MTIILSILFCIIIFGSVVFGAWIGLQMAVDQSKVKGHFKAYGKKWRVEEVNP